MSAATVPLGLRKGSCSVSSDGLNIFKLPPTLTDVEKITSVRKYPINRDLNHGAPFEFFISGNDFDFIDLQKISLYIKARVVDHRNRSLSKEESKKVAPVNNFFHSLFKKVEVRMGRETDAQISFSLPTYAYRSYLEELLSQSPDQAENFGHTIGWSPDLIDFDDIGGIVEEEDDKGVKIRVWKESENEGFRERQKLISESRTFEMMGNLNIDICCQSRMLINQVNLRILLEKSSPEFCLMFAESDGPYKIYFEDLYLSVPYVTLSNTKFVEINKTLMTQPAVYPIRRVEVSDSIIHPNFKTVRFDNLFSNTQELPMRLVCGIVSNDRFSGNSHLNPFLFHHHNVKTLSLKIDGVCIGGNSYEMNFDQDLAMEPFHNLWSRLGFDTKCSALDLNYNQFLEGSTLYAFDLTPGLTAGTDLLHLAKRGNFLLEITFEEVPTSSLNLIVYAEFQSFIEVDYNRSLYISWYDG